MHFGDNIRGAAYMFRQGTYVFYIHTWLHARVDREYRPASQAGITYDDSMRDRSAGNH
jgi:hypothetical protein